MQSLPTTPNRETAQGYASPSYMPQTPSTTYSQSSTSTGQSSPALLTPTSVSEAPTFPVMPIGSERAPTSGIGFLDASAEAGIVYDVSELVTPVTSLASSDKQSDSCLTDTSSILNSIFEDADPAAFPPILPPTPEIDEDDPLSASFVKQYLGDDALEVSDLSLPMAMDNSPFPDSSFNVLPNVAESDLRGSSTRSEERLQGIGPPSADSLPGQFAFSRTDFPFIQPQATMTNHLSMENPLASRNLTDVHTNQSLPGGYSGVAPPPSASNVVSPTLSDPSGSPGESHLTLSFSAILGLPFDDTDLSREGDLTHQSAIYGGHQVQRGQMHSDGSFEFDVDFQNKNNFLATDITERSNTS